MVAEVKKVVVRNLPSSYTEEQLVSLFSSVGKVEEDAFVSTNARISGKFGFITFENAADVSRAIDKFNGYILEGQGREGGLIVEIANEGKKKTTKIDPASIAPSQRVIIRNLPRDTDVDGVKAIVKPIGELAHDPYLANTKNGGYAFVDFVDVATATRATEKLTGVTLPNQGREGGLEVEFARNQSDAPNVSRRDQRRRSRSRSASVGKSAAAAEGGASGRRGRGRGAAAAESTGPAASEDKPKRRRNRVRKGRRSSSAAAATTSSAPAPKETTPNGRVFVSNLPVDFTAEKLAELLGKHGAIEGDVEIHSDRSNTGKYGFVNFAATESASAAIASLTGKVLPGQGREGGLALEFGKKRGTRGPRRADGAEGAAAAEPKKPRERRAAAPVSSEPPAPSSRLYVSNIPKQFTAEDLGALFGKVGPIAGELFVSDNKRLSGRFGFVNFADIDTATKAIAAFNGKVLDGQGKEGGLVVLYSAKPAPVA